MFHISMHTLPQFSVDLVKELDKDFPKVTPNPAMSMDLIMYKAGQRSVIDALLNRIQMTEQE